MALAVNCPIHHPPPCNPQPNHTLISKLGPPSLLTGTTLGNPSVNSESRLVNVQKNKNLKTWNSHTLKQQYVLFVCKIHTCKHNKKRISLHKRTCTCTKNELVNLQKQTCKLWQWIVKHKWAAPTPPYPKPCQHSTQSIIKTASHMHNAELNHTPLVAYCCA